MKRIILVFVLFFVVSFGALAQWTPTDGPNGGLISCISTNGSNTFVGTYCGGLYRSMDYGNTWSKINQGLPNPWVYSIATNGTNLYVGVYASGLYLSTDNGDTWTPINNGISQLTVNSIVLNGADIFIATNSGVFKSTDAGLNWTPMNSGLTNTNITTLAINNSNLYAGTGGSGLFMSTDFGNSWSPINYGASNLYVNCIAFNSNQIFLGTYGGVWKTINNGQSWVSVNNGISNPDVFSISKYNATLYIATSQGVYYTTNNGGFWQSFTSGLESLYSKSIAATPNNIYVGTSNGLYKCNINFSSEWTHVNNAILNKTVDVIYKKDNCLFAGTYGGVYKSYDDGNSWQMSGLEFSAVFDFLEFNNVLYAGTWQGVFKSSNNGSTWNQSDNILRWVQVKKLKNMGNTIFAATYQGVYKSTNQGTSWTAVNNGLLHTDVNVLLVNGGDLYAGTSSGGVYKSTNNGDDWIQVNIGISDLEITALYLDGTNIIAGTSNGIYISYDNALTWIKRKNNHFIRGITSHQSNLYASSYSGVFISKNNGLTWTVFNSGLNIPNNDGYASAIFSDMANLFIGTINQGVWKLSPTIENNSSWITQNAPFPPRVVPLQFSVVDSNVVWVNGMSLNNSRNFTQSIARTNNGGAIWTSVPLNGISSNFLPLVIASPGYDIGFICGYDTLTLDPIFYRTLNGGQTWVVVPGIFNHPNSSWPDGVVFWDNGKGFAYGDPYNNRFEIYFTTDSGYTWTQVSDNQNPTILPGEYGFANDSHISKVEGGIGFFTTSEGRIYKTTDYGVTWSITPDVPFFSDAGRIAASSENYIISIYDEYKYTNDGGSIWTSLNPNGNFYNYRFQYVPFSDSMFIGVAPWAEFRGIGYSYDGGKSWSDFNNASLVQPNGISHNFFSLGIYSKPLEININPVNATICSGTQVPLQLNVNSQRTMIWTGSKIPSDTMCKIDKLVHDPNYQYTWSSEPDGFYSTLQNPTVTPTENTTYFVTVTDGVHSEVASIYIPVTPIPYITGDDFTDMCSGEVPDFEIQSNILETMLNWTVQTNSSFITGAYSSSGTQMNQVLSNSGLTVDSVHYYVTSFANNCQGNSLHLIVVVAPIPTVYTLSDTSVCSDNYTDIELRSNLNNVDYSWYVSYNDPFVSGAFEDDENYITQQLFNTANVNGSIAYHITPFYHNSMFYCNGNTKVINVIVHPKPNISNQSITVCSTTPFSLTPLNGTDIVPNGTLYSWSTPSLSGGLTGGSSGILQNNIHGNLTNQTSILKTGTYSVTPSTPDMCYGLSFNVGVNVNPKPTIGNKQMQICSGNGFEVSPVNGVDIIPIGTSYTWSEPVVTGGITGGTSRSMQNSIFDTLINPTSIIQTATYTVTPTTTNSCSGAPFTVVISVNPTPFVSPQSSIICSENMFSINPLDQINGNIIPTNTSYSWGLPNTNLSITGGTTGTSQTLISGNLTNLSSDIQTATYSVIPSSNFPCIGLPFNVLVTVNPKPLLNDKTETVCSSNPFNVSFNNANDIIPLNTTYSWNNPVVNGFISGGTSGLNQSTITGLLNNISANLQAATYSVTPTYNGICTGNSFNVTVNINPKPLIPNQSLSICSDGAFSLIPINNYPFVIVPTGTNYSWGNPTISDSITGFQTSTGDTSIFGILINSSSSNQTAIYSVVPTTPQLCIGTPFNVIVTVHPKPSISNQTITSCSGDSFILSLQNGNQGNVIPQGTTYSWSSPILPNGLTGATSGSNQMNVFGSLENTLSIDNTASYSVTPTTGVPCSGNPFNIEVTVHPRPQISDKWDTICGSSPLQIIFQNGLDIIPTGTSYSWGLPSISGGVSGAQNETGEVSFFATLHNLTNSNQNAVYSVIPNTIHQCVGDTFNISIAIKPIPTITSIIDTICSAHNFSVDPSNYLSNIVPSGTLYDWDSPSVTVGLTGGNADSNQVVISGILNNNSNVTQNAIYTVTPTSSEMCTGIPFNINMFVNPNPFISDITDTVCNGIPFDYLPINGQSGNIVPINTTYSWGIPNTTGFLSGGVASSSQNQINGVLNNSSNNVQMATYTVLTTTMEGCQGNNFIYQIVVNPTSNLMFTGNDHICSGDTAELTLTSDVIGTTFIWNIGQVSSSIIGALPGTGSQILQELQNSSNQSGLVTYVVTPYFLSCMGTVDSIDVTVNPVFSFEENISLCAGDQVEWQNNTYVQSGTYYAYYSTNDGCDSAYILHLQIDTIDINVTIQNGGVTLFANTVADGYQWVDCDSNFQWISLATNQSFSPSVNGSYAVIISEGVCVDTSDCYQISNISVSSFVKDQNIIAYPNPFTNELNLKSNEDEGMDYELVNSIGQLIMKGNFSQSISLETSSIAPGLYVIFFYFENTLKSQKLIKE